jgi:hypothetical protein
MKNVLYDTLIGLALVSMPKSASAQKCKYALDGTDAMEGTRVRRMEIKLEGYYVLSLYRNGDDYRVELNVRFVGERNFQVPEGNELEIKLGNDERFTLLSAQPSSPVSYVNGVQVMTNYAISYHCSMDQMQRIARTGIAVTRVKLGDDTITYEVEKKPLEEITSKANCLLSD